jgi:hypothetical protein
LALGRTERLTPYDLKTIPLTRGFKVIVDDADYEWLSKHKWSYHYDPWGGYAKRLKDGKYVLMHREIMGAKAGEQIDHANGERMDNRRKNLRQSTQSQNLMNARKRKNSTSQFKGVSLMPSGKWRAHIAPDGKTKYLGLFKTEREAALRYNEEAKTLYGDFAKLNEVDDG